MRKLQFLSKDNLGDYKQCLIDFHTRYGETRLAECWVRRIVINGCSIVFFSWPIPFDAIVKSESFSVYTGLQYPKAALEQIIQKAK